MFRGRKRASPVRSCWLGLDTAVCYLVISLQVTRCDIVCGFVELPSETRLIILRCTWLSSCDISNFIDGINELSIFVPMMLNAEMQAKGLVEPSRVHVRRMTGASTRVDRRIGVQGCVSGSQNHIVTVRGSDRRADLACRWHGVSIGEWLCSQGQF